MEHSRFLKFLVAQLVICSTLPTCFGFANAIPTGAGSGRISGSGSSSNNKGKAFAILVSSKVPRTDDRRKHDFHRKFSFVRLGVSNKPLSEDSAQQTEVGGISEAENEGATTSATNGGKTMADSVVPPAAAASGNRDIRQADGMVATTSGQRTKTRKIIKRSALVALLGIVVMQRQSILSFLRYVKNDWLYATLDKLESAGPIGLLIYGVAFFVWQCTFGITTPVETAAGIAFGARKAILASGVAKFLGAITSFLIGRYMLRSSVEPFVERQELLGLVRDSIQETPFRVSLLMRFSPLPEFVKNYGVAVLPLSLPIFAASALLHGFTFTCLWSCLGGETAQVMKGATPSKELKLLMTAASWIGIGAQVGIGYWIKTLRDKRVVVMNRDGGK